LLTDGQIAHFQTFGFLVIRDLFSPEEVATIRRECDEIFAEARGGGPYTGKWEAVQPFFERRPFVSGLVADDRIYGLGEDLLGPDFYLGVTEGNLHSGDTPWHGGGGYKNGLPRIKIAFYLDPLTRDSGALRVVPGSHVSGTPDLLESLRDRSDDYRSTAFGVPQSQIPSFALETRPGDLAVFTEETLHGAFGGAPGRHQHAINFGRNPVTNVEVAQVRSSYERMRFSLRPCRSSINSKNPRVRKLVAPLVELGFDSHDL